MDQAKGDEVSKVAKTFIPVGVTSPLFITAITIAGAIVRLDFDEPIIYAITVGAILVWHFVSLVSVRRSKALQALLDSEIENTVINGSIVWITVALTNALLRLLPNTKQPSHIEFWWLALLTSTVAALLLFLCIPLIRKYYGLPPKAKKPGEVSTP